MRFQSTRTCSIRECGRPAAVRTFCTRHYQYWRRRQGEILPAAESGKRGGRPVQPPESRFWLYSGTADRSLHHCWLWTGALSRGDEGYPVLGVSGRSVRASRWSYEHFCGPIPLGRLVRHRCPNGPDIRCVNPAHLDIGTHRDNMQDRDDDGRTARGERGGRARLTTDAVRAIRLRCADGESSVRLAVEFGVGYTTIRAIVNHRLWLHVP